MNSTAQMATPPSPQPLAALASSTPLTRVSLAYVEQRINLYLRFGHPARTVQLDRWPVSYTHLTLPTKA